jgi:hypothetical protein
MSQFKAEIRLKTYRLGTNILCGERFYPIKMLASLTWLLKSTGGDNLFEVQGELTQDINTQEV